MPKVTIDHIRWLLLTANDQYAAQKMIDTAQQAVAYGVISADAETLALLENLVYLQSCDCWYDTRDDSIVTPAFYRKKEFGFYADSNN